MTVTDDHISLREHVDMRFSDIQKSVDVALTAQKDAVAAALAAADRAIAKAEVATEKRFENSNEWRNTVETLQRTYMPRTEITQILSSFSDKIEIQQKMLYVGLGE